MLMIEGKVSVKAAMLARHRLVHRIYLDKHKHDRDFAFIRKNAAQSQIPVTLLTREEIDEKASGKTHGGVLAEVSFRSFDTLETLFDANSFIALLEGVEDPFNLGYIMRSLYSAGCGGILLSQRNFQTSEATILKSSAGAFDYLPLVMCDDLSAALQACKEKGYTVYAAMRKDAISYFDADFQKQCVIAIGGEMRGLSRKVLQQSDQNIYIPYANDFRSALNAAGATAAIAFEIVRQKRNH